MKTQLLFICILTILASCKKDETESSPIKFSAAGGMYISAEGNFQSANSTITYYNPANNNHVTDVFKSANGRSPGDIAQSMTVINGRLYIVVNNSGKIEVCNLNSMENISTITGLTSPRFILKVDSAKAYVSDLSANHLSVINLSNNSVASTIQLNGWTEQMIMIGNKVYVTNVSSEYLYVIDPATDQVTDSIMAGKGAVSLAEDKNGKLWVLCGSDYLGSYSGALHRIDISTSTVEQSFTFSLPDNPFDLTMNATKDSLYFINNGVYKMSIAAGSLPSNAFIESNGNSFYCLAVDPSSNNVYVSDAIDFIQKGRIYKYNANGTLLNNFLAGIAPGAMVFF